MGDYKVLHAIKCPIEQKTYSGDTAIYRDDGVTFTAIYKGGIGWMTPVELNWNVDKEAESYIGCGDYLTLDEIAAQIGVDSHVTVFMEGMFSGEILEYNNYHEHEWVRHGMTKGYA